MKNDLTASTPPERGGAGLKARGLKHCLPGIHIPVAGEVCFGGRRLGSAAAVVVTEPLVEQACAKVAR